MATSGGQLGNQNAAKAKRWSMAIDAALAKRTLSRKDGADALHEIADKLVELASQGDLGALKELADRLDGKPAQAITNGDDGAFLIQAVERVIRDTNKQD